MPKIPSSAPAIPPLLKHLNERTVLEAIRDGALICLMPAGAGELEPVAFETVLDVPGTAQVPRSPMVVSAEMAPRQIDRQILEVLQAIASLGERRADRHTANAPART